MRSRDPPELLDRNFDITKKYAEAVAEVGRKEGVPVVDAWNAMFDAAGRDERALDQFLYDGLHPNAAGYEVGPLTVFITCVV
jgi:lysophospholipase L1-like esterase